ncbi:hypothetical protein Dda_0974 [Drechslerella dactyloides]|uniref:Uncharacterized protein n=1 Tax=Drechslerella dactyloides TaxID=74499 RepID=A0AAD6J8F0_DREDA|nr:hypothetical protein Dda_0974 [Drechslerella dactyloides]
MIAHSKMAVAALAAVCLAPLRVLLAVVLFAVSPVTASAGLLARLAVSLLNLPVLLARKLAVLYIYLGTASLVGICVAGGFYLFYASLAAALGLNRRPPSHSRPLASTGVVSNKQTPPRAKVADVRSTATSTPSFSIPGDSSRWLAGRAGLGMGAIDVLAAASISPTSSLSPGLAARQRIFPILEEEDEHEDDVVRRRRKGRTLMPRR